MKFQAGALALLLAAGACASLDGGAPAAQVRQADCPALANVDLNRLHARAAEIAADADAAVARLVSETPLTPEAEAAETRIRVRVPPTGMWALDNRVTLWRTDAGWRMARRDIDHRRPPPPPPPPNAPADWAAPPNPNEIVREGPVLAEDGAQLDAMLANPCLELEPTRFSHTIPMRQGHDWVCVPDSSYWAAEIIQPGRPPRLISIGCENNLGMSALVRMAASARLPAEQPEPAPNVLPFSATFEIVGDYAGREMSVTIDPYYTSMGRHHLLPPGQNWRETIPVADESPLTMRIAIEGCAPFEGQFNPGPNLATLIVQGCALRIVQD
ncbi:MAG: hypothetical protein NVV62_14515 [Terricaulis sp.]|nr:hypothetical protein [Terricaulis sp.]